MNLADNHRDSTFAVGFILLHVVAVALPSSPGEKACCGSWGTQRAQGAPQPGVPQPGAAQPKPPPACFTVCCPSLGGRAVHIYLQSAAPLTEHFNKNEVTVVLVAQAVMVYWVAVVVIPLFGCAPSPIHSPLIGVDATIM